MKSIQQNLIAMLKEHSFRKHLTIVVGMIAIATVLSVVWSLHINGITLASDDPTCGLQEHVHTEACYDWVALTDGTEGIDATEATEAIEVTESTEAELTETEAGSNGTESASIDAEDSTESLAENTEDGTESLMEDATEDATEGVTEEETESPQPGDTKVVDGVTYVYELVCGLEEHVHTDECYETDDSEDSANVSDDAVAANSAEETGDSVNSADSDVDGAADAADGTDSADGSDEESNTVASTATRLGSSNSSDDDDESGIATISEEDSESNTTSSGVDLSNYYLASTVDAGSLTSGSDYIIYTVIDNVYYVLTSEKNLVACTTVDSVSDATGDGPYYIESTGTIVYSASNTTCAGSVWTMTQSGSDSYYYAKNNSTDEYLAASGDGSSSDLTIGNAFSAHTGEITFYGDFTLTYTFTDTCNGLSSYENYIVEMVSNGVYLDVRSDNYGWFANADSSDTLAFGDGLDDDGWAAWTQAMQSGQTVTVTITKNGADVVVKTSAAGETFTATAYVSEYADAALTVYLTGENCTISDLTYTATVNTVQLTGDSNTLTCGATGATMSGTPLSLIAGISSNAFTWVSSTNTNDGAVFYFAEVQDAADNYHFTESVTLKDAAENQDDSYVVYTKIDDTYYIVSAVDGSLLECTDLTDSSYSDDEKVLLSAAAGVYIWSYDTNGEPEFKFTTGTDDSGEDVFEDYRWTVSSSDYDTTSGTGTYTLNNANNSDYLAPELDVVTDTLVRGANTYSTNITLDDYGKVEYTITVDGSYQSGGVGYAYFRTYIYNASNSNRYLCVWTPNVAVGTEWSGSALSLSQNGYGEAVGYGMGTMSLNVGDVLTLTITTAEDSVILNYYNQTTGQTCIYYIDMSGVGSQYLFGSGVGARIFFNSVYGNYTVSAVTAHYESTTYGVPSSITANSSNGTYTIGNALSEVGVSGTSHPTLSTFSGDFDVTYEFTDQTTDASNLANNFTIEVNNGESSATYIDVNFATQWTYNASSGSFSTNNSYSDDTTALQAALEAGAACKVRVVRTGNNFLFVLSATYNGTTYTRYATVTVDDFDGCDANVYLMGQNCTISGLTYTDNTVGTYNETTYNRVADAAKTISLTAAGSDGSSVSTESYLWTAEASGYYSEDFTLIAQLATDAANTAEIEWVEDATAGAATSGTAKITLANASVGTLSDTVAVTFSLARVKEYYVWFDGTNGGMTSYSVNSSVTAYDEVMTIPYDAYGNLETITTPSTITDASGYGTTTNGGYTLRGWYDIYNAKYYEPGEEVTLTDNTVMYADWEVTSYNIAQERTNNLASTVSTNSFITTRLFDYNELFNAQSTVLTDSVARTATVNSVTYSTTDYQTLTLSEHRELFNFSSSSSIALGSSSSLGFLFFRTETYPFYYTQLGYTVNGYNPLIDFPDGRGGTINASGNEATTGILGGYGTLASSVSLLTTLFGTGNTVDDVDDPSEDSFVLGKTYVGTADYLFQYDKNTGYYYYNSAVNAASYYGAENRFYVYDYKVMANTGGSNPSTDDFLPYNYGTSGESISMNNINYWFGMSTEIEFYLPDDVPDTTPTTATENLAIDDSHHMTFKFSGDDDVWVFIDGVLVLDLGGVHGQVYGEIDFSTGEVTVVNTVDSTTITLEDWDGDGNGDVINYTSAATAEEQTSAETYVRKLESGTHTLTFYYLERGSSQSNAAIYFNILSTQYNLNLAKVDEEDTTTSLDGAEFTFYTDSNFTELAENLEDENGNEKSTFSSSETVYGLREGKLYYVLETASPDGYTAEGKYFTVILKQGVLTITVYDSSDTKQELYVYNLTYNSTDGSVTVTRDSNAEAGVTNAYDWDYILGDTATFSATTSGGTVSYYTIGFSIANTKEYELPSTGSIGLFPYERAGAVLVLVSIVGLLTIAFYDIVRARRLRTNVNKGCKEGKAGREKRFAGTRDRPQERSVTHSHARDRPGDR